MALRAGYIGMGALQRHCRVRTLVVVKTHRPKRGVPRCLRVTMLALFVGFANRPMRLLLFMAVCTALTLTNKNP